MLNASHINIELQSVYDNYIINKAIVHRFEKFEDVIKEISLIRECTALYDRYQTTEQQAGPWLFYICSHHIKWEKTSS